MRVLRPKRTLRHVPVRGGGSRRTLAWALGLSGAAACAVTAGLTVAAGLTSAELLLYPTFIAFGLLGSLIASRKPDNSIGWLMCITSLASVLFFLPLDFGYTAQVIRHGSWPLGGVALWTSAWAWIPIVGVSLPVLTVRFPDGRLPSRWRAVNWLVIAGTTAAVLGVAVAPPEVLVRLLLVPRELHAQFVPLIQSPLGSLVPTRMAAILVYGGFALIALAYLASLISVLDRYRQASGDERLQLRWFAYSGGLLAVAIAYAVVTTVFGVSDPAYGEIPFHLSFFALPFAIAVAILRYRLYEIDLIINKTLVYGSLTAILGAVYAAVVTFLNRLFISASGQKSDAAYIVTAFVVVIASSPIKDWLQRQVDRRVAHRSPSAMLDEFRAGVDAVVSVMDTRRVAFRFVDQAVTAFNARGGALYLRSAEASKPLYTRGQLNGDGAIEVALRYEDQQLGRLVLGSRRGDITYTEDDRLLLQRSADSVGEALALASHLGFQPLPRTH